MGAVGGDPVGRDGGLHAAALTAVDPEIGRFAEDRHIGPDALSLDQVAHAVAVAVLFHDGGCEIKGDAFGYSAVSQHLGAVGHPRDRRQLVDRSPAPDLSIFELAGEGIEVPVVEVTDADAIDMAVEEDFEISRTDPRNHGAETVNEDLIESKRFILASHPFAAITFFAAFGRNRDQVSQEADDLLLVAAGRINLVSSLCHGVPLAARSPMCTIVRPTSMSHSKG